MKLLKKGFIKKAAAMIITAGIALSMTVGVYAAEEGEATLDSAGNVFTTGEDVIGGDYFAGFGAGRKICFTNANTEDSITAAGATIEVENCSVGGSVFVAGNEVRVIDSEVKGNIVTAGNQMTINKDTTSKSVIAVGNQVEFYGEADSLHFACTTAVIDGVVNGDAEITAESVTITDNAVIKGELKVYSSADPGTGAASVGKYVFEKSEEQVEKSFASKVFDKVKSAVYWAIAMSIVGFLMCLLIPTKLEDAARMVKYKTGAMLGSGAVVFFIFPIAAIMLCVTYVGLPLAGISTLIYSIILMLSVAFAGASLGRIVFDKLNPILASIVGIAILEVVKKIPFIGGLVFLAAAVYTLGFFIQTIWNGRLRKATSKNVAEAVVVSESYVAPETDAVPEAIEGATEIDTVPEAIDDAAETDAVPEANEDATDIAAEEESTENVADSDSEKKEES